MERRIFLRNASAFVTSLMLSSCGGSDSDGNAQAVALPTTPTPGPTPQPTATSLAKARVIVIGGGMAGATVAKYLRLWGDSIEVTLIDKAQVYTSNILSSLVLTGQRSIASLEYSYDTLRSTYGINFVHDEVVAIDPAATEVTMASGARLKADRIVLAPGIDFDAVPGLTDSSVMPHAWKAGPQTTLLAQQLAAMPSGGTVVLTIPPAPYRCPPGPYERACLVADWLRLNKPTSKLLVLDANPQIIVEKDNFESAFTQLYAGIVEYHSGVAIDSVDQVSKTLNTSGGMFRGDVINLIPRQKAPPLVSKTGLANDATGRFASVNVLDYSSTAAPTIHVIGDSSATTQPKAGHIANQEAKICADAIIRSLGGLAPDPAPITTSSCFSTITMTQASWLHAMYEYNGSAKAMQLIPASFAASAGWSTGDFKDMNTWFGSLMADSFA